MYYYCFVLDEWCKKNTTVSSFASVDMVGFKKFRFPVPPLEVQREIVKVLDTFTELEAELEAELESRRRQYAHYRNTLFSLPDSGCRSVRILDVAEVRSGWGFPIAEQGNPGGTLPFYKVSDMNSVGNETFMSSANSYIDTSTAARLGVKAAPAGTVIFPKIGAAVGTNKKRMLSVESAYDNNVMGLIPAPLIRSGYLFHRLQTFDLLQVANDSGAVPSIRKSDMEQILIPLPDIAEQDRIVGILDKFDALVNDLTTGLPAELQARRQQYEYYRDKLLTFDEVAS
ncbi:MAG: restriction endonuclease subunit S [Marmoricola sp.]